IGDKLTLALALVNMAGVLLFGQRELETARAYREEGRRLFKEIGSHWYKAMSSYCFWLFLSSPGNYAQTRSSFLAGLSLFVGMGDKHGVNMVRSELAHLERRQGHFAQAKPLYRETIQEWQQLGHRAAIAHQLECFAFLAKAQEEAERVAKLFGAAEV